MDAYYCYVKSNLIKFVFVVFYWWIIHTTQWHNLPIVALTHGNLFTCVGGGMEEKIFGLCEYVDFVLWDKVYNFVLTSLMGHKELSSSFWVS